MFDDPLPLPSSPVRRGPKLEGHTAINGDAGWTSFRGHIGQIVKAYNNLIQIVHNVSLMEMPAKNFHWMIVAEHSGALVICLV